MTSVRFRVLGPVLVEVDGQPLAIPTGRERTLLAWLLLHREGVSAQATIDALWGDDDRSAHRAALRAVLSRLRRRLGDGGVVPQLSFEGERLALHVPGAEIDAEDFENLLEVAYEQLGGPAPTSAGRVLVRALSMWRGGAYAELAESDTGRAEATRLEELRLDAVEANAALRMAYRPDVNLVPDLAALVEGHPYRERAWRLLMAALGSTGRQGEALRVYQRCRTALAELGVMPSPPTKGIERALLTHARIDPDAMVSVELGIGFHPRRVTAERSDQAAESMWQLARERAGATVVVMSGSALSLDHVVVSLRTFAAGEGGHIIEILGMSGGGLLPLADGLRAAELPSIEAVARALEAWPSGDADVVSVANRRHAILGQLAQALREVARSGPLGIVATNIDQSDPPTASVVRFLADALGHEPVLFVLTLAAPRAGGSSVASGDPALADLSRRATWHHSLG